MKLIEAEKAKDAIHEYFKSLMINGASGTDVDRLAVGIVSCLKHDANLLKAIDELPSIQPDIIRCKDCKFYTAYDYTGKLMCKRIGKGMILPKPEDYCSYAERITDGKPD